VFLTDTTDRELYLPVSWTKIRQRCATAGIPPDTTFATKTTLAERMIVRALDEGVSAAWVAVSNIWSLSLIFGRWSLIGAL
jgi:SRSO17 transposase